MNMPANQTHNIDKHAIEHSTAIAEHRERADDLDKLAKEHISERDAAHAELKRIRAEWTGLFEKLERLKEEVAGAKEALGYGQDQSKLRLDRYFGWQTGTNTQFLQEAQTVATIIAGVPILKQRLELKEKLLSEHRDKIKAFGREHKMDPAILGEL